MPRGRCGRRTSGQTIDPVPGLLPRSGHRRAVARGIVRSAVLQPVATGHKSLADYTHICGRELIEEIRELAEPLKGKRVVHVSATAFGGRRLGDPVHARAADARRGVGLRVAGDLRARGVLQRDQADAQRLAGQSAGSRRGAVGHLGAVQRDERARALRGLGRVPRARPAAGGPVPAGAREGQGLGLALPHRPVDPQSSDDRAAVALHRRISAVALPHGRATSLRGWAGT